MRWIRSFTAAMVMVATCAAAMPADTSSSMPDPARQYHARRNCHNAYDLLIERFKGGGAVSANDKAWGAAYEDAAKAKTPCPAPPEELATAATNRTVSTENGLANVAKYLEQNDPVAYFEGGWAVVTGKAPSVSAAEGYAMLKKAAELGDPSAQYLLGMLYVAGNVTGKPDYASALPLIEKAAQTGHVDALFQTGNFYSDGISVKADKKKAFGYYSKAAERGHVYATYLAAYMANSGEGTKEDHVLAYRLARNLADQGEVVGAVIAASALLQQKNAKQHENEVLYWMDVAIRDGDQKIRTEVGKFRPQVVAAYQRAKAPPEYRPRVRKPCPMKTVCLVNRFTGVQQCTTNKDYWNDCDF